jgi:hypothetical protein
LRKERGLGKRKRSTSPNTPRKRAKTHGSNKDDCERDENGSDVASERGSNDNDKAGDDDDEFDSFFKNHDPLRDNGPVGYNTNGETDEEEWLGLGDD